METITHPTLVQLVAAGAVRVVVAVGQPGGWTLLVRYGLAERALAAQRSKQLRVFRKLDTMVLYLQQIGSVASRWMRQASWLPRDSLRAPEHKSDDALLHSEAKLPKKPMSVSDSETCPAWPI
ncbi:hypothetical protein PCI56_00220 [Plesiomonas shigelloides subsp. oncorhynchi]|nr:hypothetical protein [Plesiomonas shigelloides]